jgi:hypothetical protein
MRRIQGFIVAAFGCALVNEKCSNGTIAARIGILNATFSTFIFLPVKFDSPRRWSTREIIPGPICLIGVPMKSLVN